MAVTDRYTIRQVLSESSRGMVSIATDTSDGKEVVLRLLYHTNADYYRILQQIGHPQLAAIYEVMQDGEDTLVAEEKVDGLTLAEFLERGKVFTLPEILAIFSQLCYGLNVIHHHGIIHRDIKPSNIVVGNERVVLIDFDAARLYRPEPVKDTVYMGTEGYAAPEQYGFSQTDSRTDIYALGVVIRELCTGPVDSRLDTILRRCTAFDPANRYVSAGQILDDLRSSGLLPPAAPPPVPPMPAAMQPLPPARAKKTPLQVLHLALRVYFGLAAVVLLVERAAHEVTVTDYLLSKCVYMAVVLFPAIITTNLFHIWQKAPLLRSPHKPLKVLGVLLYILIFLIVITLLNTLAHALYSPEALEILKNTPN